jgi:hypothetical protein
MQAEVGELGGLDRQLLCTQKKMCLCCTLQLILFKHLDVKFLAGCSLFQKAQKEKLLLLGRQ